MAYDEDLADRLRVALQGVDGVSEKRMFGGLAFLVNGNLAVAASGQGGLMVRCDPADADEHVARGATRMVMRGQEMDGWLRVAADHLSDAEGPDGEGTVAGDDALRRWVDVGVDYARGLPAK